MNTEFADLLHDLIRNSGIKNITLSEAVGYDLSYISKWLSGKLLPSEKSIGSVAGAAAKAVAGFLTAENSAWFLERYGTSDPERVREAVEKDLTETYAKCRSRQKKDGSAIGFYPEISAAQLIGAVCRDNREICDLTVLSDLFSLDRRARLDLLGIEKGSFSRTQYRPEVRISLVLSTEQTGDLLYDSLYLIHLLSALSLYDFSAYDSREALGRHLLSVNDSCCVSALSLKGETGLSAAGIVHDHAAAEVIRKKIRKLMRREDMLFDYQSMTDFIRKQSYIKSMLSANVRWIIGHCTELVLPDELFTELLDVLPEEQHAEVKKIHSFSQSILMQPTTRILLYETAVSDMLATGEFDFFNRKVILSPAQQKRYIDHISSLITDGTDIRLIEGGFCPDFQHLNSPCLFISDSICYLRLENAYERDNIMVIGNGSSEKLFERFFEAAWNSDEVVISRRESILKKLKHYKTMVSLLE